MIEKLTSRYETINHQLLVINDILKNGKGRAIAISSPFGYAELPLPDNFHEWLADHSKELQAELGVLERKLTAIDAILNA